MSSDITSSPAEVAVTVNGVARALAAGSSLRDLIEALGFAARPGADRLTRQTKLLVIRFDIETDLVRQALGQR